MLWVPIGGACSGAYSLPARCGPGTVSEQLTDAAARETWDGDATLTAAPFADRLRILIVDESKEYMTMLRRGLARHMPNIEVTEYDPDQSGRPSPGFDWSAYDILLLANQLGSDDGLAWLRTYGHLPGFPVTVLLHDEATSSFTTSGGNYGVALTLSKTSIQPKALAQAIVDVLSQRRADSLPNDRTRAGGNRHEEAFVFSELKLTPDEKPNGGAIGYRFVRLIGQSATSRVYLAERKVDRATLVLKVVNLSYVSEVQLKRFVREAELMATIDSPYVVRFLEHGFTEHFGFIAMEFFTRGDLKQRVELGIATDDAVLYLRHVLYGLRAIHQYGIVHRDLKPGNIMFRSDDSLALADFGISKHLDDDNEITRRDSVLGTPNYLSPEQAACGKIDHRSDLYSAGAIFYEMLTGRKPFTADNAAALVYHHVHAPVPKLPAEHACFQPLITRLLAKKPADRPYCANETLDELCKIEGISAMNMGRSLQA